MTFNVDYYRRSRDTAVTFASSDQWIRQTLAFRRNSNENNITVYPYPYNINNITSSSSTGAQQTVRLCHRADAYVCLYLGATDGSIRSPISLIQPQWYVLFCYSSVRHYKGMRFDNMHYIVVVWFWTGCTVVIVLTFEI